MACHHPLKAFWTGKYTDNGKKEYYVCPMTAGNYVNAALAERKGFKIGLAAPMVKFGNNIMLKDPVSIPCGHCVGCRMDRAREWKVRLVHEAVGFPECTHFVTLTYDDSHLPITPEGEPTLVKKELSNFMKRLRTYSGQKFRFFACGEYGGETKRPHYHIILFGLLDDLVPFAFKRYHSELIAKAWPYGLHEVSPANENCMAYVAGYVEKKQRDPDFWEYPVKPFLLMSRKPAIGSAYVEKLDGSPDRKVYGNFGSNHYAGIPRAYLKKCEDLPWFKDYKAESEKLAKLMAVNNACAYGTTDEEKQGFIADDIAVKQLEKVREEKI